jgi:two-component system, chemotaxis family, chemotaxis protein CheY
MRIDRATPVLIVERRITFARLIERMFHDARFQNVETTREGKTALGILRRDGRRVILVDLELEVVSWLEILQQVRAHEELASSPFIVTSESLRAREARQLKDAGIDGVLLKPFKRDALEPKLTMASERAARHRPLPKVNALVRARSSELGRRLFYPARRA